MPSNVTAHDFSRLITVTHREPFHLVARDDGVHVEKTTGGLIAALEPAMRALRGLWISAAPRGDVEVAVSQAIDELPYSWEPVRYSPGLYRDFYLGFSNEAAWPLFHSMLGLARFHRRHWAAYQQVNRHFAEVIRGQLGERDLVWVHDYQLLLVPALLREEPLPTETRVGFFLHIPFPPFDLFRTLPWAKEILRGMLGASLIGFHVAEYAANFFDCVEQLLELRCDRLRGRVQFGERAVHVRSIPIGIDTGAIYRELDRHDSRARVDELRASTPATHLLVGVDRLDYTKGILERLKALETFFARSPARKGTVAMLQVAVPSRAGIDAYQALRDDIERAVGHINGLYGTPEWTPVTFMCRSLPFEELVALYRASDVALVTPLRDGMNLVAKEFVAAHRDGDGVLILSALAGAAQQLTEAELVNPYHADGIATALSTALEMPADLRRRKMRRMNAKVQQYDVQHWIDSFLSEALYVD
ncbi:MAG: alpha,alpha-trehalose-phosphate synthase (UDP-forming) [Myxococcota bacterium]